MNITVITMVTDRPMYEAMVVKSLKGHGFRFLPLYGAVTAARALNQGIGEARDDLLILCHQDVSFPDNFDHVLANQLGRINEDFGVAGTYGKRLGKGWGRIWNPYPNRRLEGNVDKLPGRVHILDEHCLILRKSSGLRFDENNPTFHLYGADICMTACERGLKCWAIDSGVNHLSPRGDTGQQFHEGMNWMVAKWRDRWPNKILPLMSCEVDLEAGNWRMYI